MDGLKAPNLYGLDLKMIKVILPTLSIAKRCSPERNKFHQRFLVKIQINWLQKKKKKNASAFSQCMVKQCTSN